MVKPIFKGVVFSLMLFLPVGTTMGEAMLSKDAVADKMKIAIRDYISDRFRKDPIRIQVRGMTPILTGKIVSNEDQVEVKRGPEGEGTKGFVGRKLFLISVKQDNGRSNDYWVTAEVAVSRKVLVASRSIKRKERIDAEVLTELTYEQTEPNVSYVDDPEQLLGKQATRPILPGVPITDDMVEDSPLISRGDRITLFAEADGLIVSTSVRAKEEGFLGKQIAVSPMSGNGQKVLYGTVVSPSRVKVEF
ncbi:MAG: flagellar basal body P-ring formation chaperone FlgA [Nitrospirota bacterium]